MKRRARIGLICLFFLFVIFLSCFLCSCDCSKECPDCRNTLIWPDDDDDDVAEDDDDFADDDDATDDDDVTDDDDAADDDDITDDDDTTDDDDDSGDDDDDTTSIETYPFESDGIYSEILGCGHPGEEESNVMLDSQGNVHVAINFCRRIVHYTVSPAKTEDSEVVVPFGDGPRMAIDSSDRLHLLYYDLYEECLIYLMKSSGAWQEVARFASDYSDSALAIDLQGNAHILYNRPIGLWYATNASGTWNETEAYDSGSGSVTLPFMTVGADGSVHIVFQWYAPYTPSQTIYLNNQTGLFVSKNISHALLGWPEDIKLDSQGKVHITGPGQYATNKSGIWKREWIGALSLYTVLFIDASDIPHVAYVDQDRLVLAEKGPSGWQETTIRTDMDKEASLDLVLDSSGKAYISHYQDSELKHWLADDAGGTWSFTTLTTGSDDPTYNINLKQDGQKRFHASYVEEHNEDLIYLNNVPGYWTKQSVPADHFGHYVEMDINSGDQACLTMTDSYYDQLLFGCNEGGSWNFDIVDDSDRIGSGNSLWIDDSDTTHILFWDGYADSLNYATGTPGSWSKEHVYDMGAELSTSIFHLDEAGHAHIAFFIGEDHELFYGTNKGGAWNVELVDAGITDRLFPHNVPLALDSNGKVNILYYTGPGTGIRVATNESGTWSYDVLDANGTYGLDAAIDQDDHLHAVYFDDSTFEMKYANNSTGTWAFATVDKIHYRDRIISSIVLDSGQVHVLYTIDDAILHVSFPAGMSK